MSTLASSPGLSPLKFIYQPFCPNRSGSRLALRIVDITHAAKVNEIKESILRPSVDELYPDSKWSKRLIVDQTNIEAGSQKEIVTECQGETFLIAFREVSSGMVVHEGQCVYSYGELHNKVLHSYKDSCDTYAQAMEEDDFGFSSSSVEE